MAMTNGNLRIAAVADIHCNKSTQSILHGLFAQINDRADILLLGGDLTDIGLPEEAHVLARELTTTVKIPVIGVLGNHDYESGQPDQVKEILCDAGVSLLDGDTCVVHGVGFAGIKGFAGGFGKVAVQAFGESAIKHFVQETVNEALRLESALARLEDMTRIVLLHYAPVRKTVEGEPPEIFPFLGSSRLEEPVNRFDVAAVFHGHAHGGSPEGHTLKGVPVYNVSMQVLRKAYPERAPFRLLQIPVEEKAAEMLAVPSPTIH
ncbi:MAG: metallophosphoesterase [Chloroflexi bacterium]|nr:metallophosphoesterase [Chloroflexota bacterium]